MITTHPQRWTDRPLPWVKELIWQGVKNVVKGILVVRGQWSEVREQRSEVRVQRSEVSIKDNIQQKENANQFSKGTQCV
jgi:hypothetical protein